MVDEDPVDAVAVLVEECDLLGPTRAHVQRHSAASVKRSRIQRITLAVYVPARNSIPCHKVHTAVGTNIARVCNSIELAGVMTWRTKGVLKRTPCTQALAYILWVFSYAG